MDNNDDDTLIGNKTEAILAAIKLNRAARVIARITKRPCNCGQRKMKLNEMHRKLRAKKQERDAMSKERRDR